MTTITVTIAICYLLCATWSMFVMVGVDIRGGTAGSNLVGWRRGIAVSMAALSWPVTLPMLVWGMADAIDWQEHHGDLDE